MGIRIFIDDTRYPKTESFNLLPKSYNDFEEILKFCKKYGIKISYISFDHDLGLGKSGYDCATRLCYFDMDHSILAPDFDYNVHSANPVGASNIRNYMDCYLKVKQERNNNEKSANSESIWHWILNKFEQLSYYKER